MEAKLQKAFLVLKDHAILPFLHRQGVMRCVPWHSHGRLGLGITVEVLTRLVHMALQEREFWQGSSTAPDPEGYFSASFMLYRDIVSEMLGPVSDSPKAHHEFIDVRECPG